MVRSVISYQRLKTAAEQKNQGGAKTRYKPLMGKYPLWRIDGWPPNGGHPNSISTGCTAMAALATLCNSKQSGVYAATFGGQAANR